MNEPLMIPEWIAAVIGRLVLENEAFRRGLIEAPSPASINGLVPEPESSR